MKQKTLKDILKKFRELPSVKYLDKRIRKEIEEFLTTEITELLKQVVEIISYDMDFKDEKQRKAAVKMYLEHFGILK